MMRSCRVVFLFVIRNTHEFRMSCASILVRTHVIELNSFARKFARFGREELRESSSTAIGMCVAVRIGVVIIRYRVVMYIEHCEEHWNFRSE